MKVRGYGRNSPSGSPQPKKGNHESDTNQDLCASGNQRGRDLTPLPLAACSGDSVGNVYVADRENYTIRKVTADGVVTTLAGQPGSSGSNDGTVKLWHLATGREVYGFTLAFTDVFTMAWLMFSNDGKNLLAGRYDGSRSADEFLARILRAPSLAEIEAEEKAAAAAR